MKRKLLFFLAGILFLSTASAQQDSIPDSLTIGQAAAVNAGNGSGRKKVAVVLSGGGAKGMAHIGVLKVLERAGIPVDIITGTSMGSIVGGLYAIGYSAHDLDSVVRAQDWSYVITDKEDLSKQSLGDIQKQNTYAFSMGMTLGKHSKDAGGLIKGKNLAELFQKLCVGYTDSLDFSRNLPIPFACVATNIIDNTEVDFHSGRLPQAMRASMAIPMVFSPVRKDDMVLVDGGLRNNFPTDIAKQMGADVIIGVMVHDRPKSAGDVWGTVSMLSQIIDVNCKNKYEENMAITDVPIYVDPTGYSAASFSATAIDTLIRRGEEEGMRHWDELMALKRQIGLDEDYRPQPLQHPHFEKMLEQKPIKEYVFENMTQKDIRFLRQKFHLKNTSQKMDELFQQITTSMRIDLFYQSAEYRLEPDGDGVRVVFTAGNRKTSEVHVGLRFDTEEYAAVQFGADIPIQASIPINTDIVFRLGKRIRAGAELTFHPSSFTKPTLSYNYRRNDVDVYIYGDRDYNIHYDQHSTEFTPINLSVRHFDLRIGLRYDYLHYRNKLESGHSRSVNVNNEHYFSYRAQLKYNSEDNWNFPTRGARFKAGYTYLTNTMARLNDRADDGSILRKTRGMSDVNANWRMSFTFGSRFTLQPMVYGRLLFGPVVPFVFGNCVGGEWFGHYVEQQMPFAGVGNMEYVDNQFVAFQLQAQQHIGSSHYVLFRVAGAQQSDKLKNLFDHRTMLGCQAAYYYNTMIGPAGVTLGYSNRTKQVNFFINLGYEF